jgi:hypothetical protein
MTSLLQNDHADINTESSDGYTLLCHLCEATLMPDHDQHEVVMFFFC